jgi:hypothetical protein
MTKLFRKDTFQAMSLGNAPLKKLISSATSMVYYSTQADSDLDDILNGLLSWEKFTLTRDFCLSYVADIIDVCDSLDTKDVHLCTSYETHKRHGDKVHKYSRNKNTTWYIIYDIDSCNNVYINKIISNYMTIS